MCIHWPHATMCVPRSSNLVATCTKPTGWHATLVSSHLTSGDHSLLNSSSLTTGTCLHFHNGIICIALGSKTAHVVYSLCLFSLLLLLEVYMSLHHADAYKGKRKTTTTTWLEHPANVLLYIVWIKKQPRQRNCVPSETTMDSCIAAQWVNSALGLSYGYSFRTFWRAWW